MIPWKCPEKANSETKSTLAVARGWESRRVEGIPTPASVDGRRAPWMYSNEKEDTPAYTL